ncbi:craniofacial development protein 2-like [Eurosta solidaginis]|uniref:craniofacial development protein 2-like n=1 Tax=Eurosta solidaginis TaxID=178769 RepID=UPI0035316C32
MKYAKKPRIITLSIDDDHGKRLKDNELRACTWNVRSLNGIGADARLVDVLIKSYDIYLSGHTNKRSFGVGFVARERICLQVLAFTPVDERLAAIQIKAKFINISFTCAQAPTEEKDDELKDTFYEQLERTYERCPRHDTKVVLGDFNVRVCKGVFGPTVGKFSLHNETSPNGLRLIDFAGAPNMVFTSTMFMHKKIHQATWLSPDRNTRNQIDHVVIGGRHVSRVLDVRTIRGPNIDLDHYLVAAKILTRLCAAKTKEQKTQGKLDVERLQSQRSANDFATRLSHLLSESTTQPVGMQEPWEHISKALHIAAEEKIGYQRESNYRSLKMSWWTKIAQGIMIAIAGYEIGKGNSETAENKIVEYEPPDQVDTKTTQNITDIWLGALICTIGLLVIAIAAILKN